MAGLSLVWERTNESRLLRGPARRLRVGYRDLVRYRVGHTSFDLRVLRRGFAWYKPEYMEERHHVFQIHPILPDLFSVSIGCYPDGTLDALAADSEEMSTQVRGGETVVVDGRCLRVSAALPTPAKVLPGWFIN